MKNKKIENAKENKLVNEYDSFVEQKRKEITETLVKEAEAQGLSAYKVVALYPFTSFKPNNVHNVFVKKDYQISTLIKTAYALGFEVALKKREQVEQTENISTMKSHDLKTRVKAMEMIFLSTMPHIVSFQYRKKNFKDDKPILAKLLAEGKIVLVQKDSKKITYCHKGSSD